MTRHFRSATYKITIRKPKGIQTGRVSILLDGCCVPVQAPGGTHNVLVWIH